MNTDNEKVMIDKYEYEDLKKQDRDNQELMFSDFAVKIYRGAVLHPSHPNYNDNRIKMEIFSADFTKLNKYSIQIDGKDYNIRSQNLFNKIKQFVSNNLDVLISWSKRQTNENLNNNAYEGGMGSSIQIKYGQLIVNVNGQTMDLREMCNEFIDELKNLVINEGEKTQEDYMMELFEKVEPQTPTPLDEEFDKYSKLYEERFGKRAYIAEPSGTKEQTINAIKICLEKNEDLLDKLLYPNLEKDMENGVLYSETKVDLNNDKFDAKTTDENLKSIIDEVINNNAEIIGNIAPHCNTTVYDIMKKIIDLPSGTTTTIADLINYNPNEKFVEPIMQGQIEKLVKETCKKLNIELDENRDKIGGLAYYSEFKKVNNDKFVWKEGEIKIAKTQCEFCKHNDKEHPSVCFQYPNGKPNEVINNNIKCPRFDKQINTTKEEMFNKYAKKLIIQLELGLSYDDLDRKRLEDANAFLYFPKNNQRGLGGIIVGNDLGYLVCGSIYPLQHYIEEFKNGNKSYDDIISNSYNSERKYYDTLQKNLLDENINIDNNREKLVRDAKTQTLNEWVEYVKLDEKGLRNIFFANRLLVSLNVLQNCSNNEKELKQIEKLNTIFNCINEKNNDMVKQLVIEMKNLENNL